MTDSPTRAAAKRLLGSIPLTAEVAQRLRPGGGLPIKGYSVDRLECSIPGWVEAVQKARRRPPASARRRVLVIGYLRWWLEYASALGLLLSGLGHEVDLAFLPFQRWSEDTLAFDVRRQRAYLRKVLQPLGPLVGIVDLDGAGGSTLPPDLDGAIHHLSRIDVQYTGLRERINFDGDTPDAQLLGLRLQRNRKAAQAALRLMRSGAYDVVLIPNGSILEFGAVYQAARSAGVRTVTYEFGEQRERMWIAQDDQVMRLDTAALWAARGGQPLMASEIQSLQELYRARRGGTLWANFSRLWQPGEVQGPQTVRQRLGLDPHRTVVLLCTNVVGDSLALGRQIFTEGMAGWLRQTVSHFADRPEAQLVVRVHPAEKILVGDPSVDIVHEALPDLPRHVIVVPPESEINTYDLMEVADVGLAYTTTVGMEMAMAGIPVVVSGRAHYRGKGFTYDPSTLDEYLTVIDGLLASNTGRRLSAQQVELAQRYAYLFFFEYPFVFPWHLVHFWDDIAARPLQWVLEPANTLRYGRALAALLGEEIDWGRRSGGAAEGETGDNRD